MKRVIFIAVLILFPIKALAISAESYIAMDLETGRVLMGHNIDEKKLIASTTKIMTAIVTIENADLDEEVTVKEEVLKAYGSAIYIEVGEKLTLRDLLYGLMLRSGNDAAIVIAKNVAGSMENFSMLMNEYANKIGMKDSYFYNAHGLEEDDNTGNTSTAYDMALLTRYAIKNKEFAKIFSTKNYVVKTNYKSYSWTNKNKLLHNYDFITGGKTGYTQLARRTLVTTASNNNTNIVVVTLNDSNDFADHIRIYKEIFKKYEAIKVLNQNKFKIKNETKYKDNTLYINEDVYIPLTEEEQKNIEIKYELYDVKTYLDNDLIGYAKIYLNDEEIYKEEIYILKENKEENLSWWDKLLRWLKW